jgi:hypothetical protein
MLLRRFARTFIAKLIALDVVVGNCPDSNSVSCSVATSMIRDLACGVAGECD